MARSARPDRGRSGTRPGQLPPRQAHGTGTRKRRATFLSAPPPITSTPFRREQEVPYPGDIALGAAHQEPDALERDGDGVAPEQVRRWHRRPYRHLCLAGHAAGSRLQPLLPRQLRRSARRPRLFQGHASPGIYARAFLEGRLTEEHLKNFRHELRGTPGLSSYPHPWLMKDFWQFPTVSMGLGPINSIYQARFMRYLENRGLIPATARKVWAFLGDGEMDEPESTGAIGVAVARKARQPDLRHQLQPAAAGRPGARQRQDHSGTGRPVPRRGLERDQVHVGRATGIRCSPKTSPAGWFS